MIVQLPMSSYLTPPQKFSVDMHIYIVVWRFAMWSLQQLIRALTSLLLTTFVTAVAERNTNKPVKQDVTFGLLDRGRYLVEPLLKPMLGGITTSDIYNQ